jgi:Domain of Unknown Function (DUF1206)
MAVRSEAKQAARSPWVGVIGRIGQAARGVLFAVVGVLALEVAFGARQRTPDKEGAFRAIADQPLGELLLALLAIGLAGFGVWRLSQGLLGRHEEGGGKPGGAKRVGYVALGLFYLATAVLALALVVGSGSSQGSEKEETARALEWPLGRYAVAAVGAGFLIAGIANLFRSLTRKFRNYLREEQLGEKAREWAIAVGVVGHAARAVVFSLVGIFLLRAALEYDPNEAIGLDGALAKLADQPYGDFLLGVVAAGLLAYAAFCFIQARYGDV